MFALTVCDHIMIAHSFRGAEFGPAQRLHGATFAVEAEFRAPRLDTPSHLLVDIGLAKQALRAALEGMDYRNLDESPEFAGQNTTTEYLAAHIHGLLVAAVTAGGLGPQGAGVSAIKVTLRESPNAWASYEAAIA
ncbi:MAG: 6-carboxytetrahydropterin synthase [Acetobacteraceae bacterium]|nr:6-carboxytetrahydropterin synthase [Acetobacteraceae bacterium]